MGTHHNVGHGPCDLLLVPEQLSSPGGGAAEGHLKPPSAAEVRRGTLGPFPLP